MQSVDRGLVEGKISDKTMENLRKYDIFRLENHFFEIDKDFDHTLSYHQRARLKKDQLQIAEISSIQASPA